MISLETEVEQIKKASEVWSTSNAKESSNMLQDESLMYNKDESPEQLNLDINLPENESAGNLDENSSQLADFASVLGMLNSLPDGYFYMDGFICYSDKSDENGNIDYDQVVKICSPVVVVAKCSDVKGLAHGKVVKVLSRQRGVIQTILPAEIIGADPHGCITALMKLGLEITDIANKLRVSGLLNKWDPGKFATTVGQNGWDSRLNYFVFGDSVFKRKGVNEEIIYEGLEDEHTFTTKGTFDAWYENVACLCQGNSRFMLAMSAAFAGPLMKLTNTASGGIHFYASSSTGKSICAIAAGSVVGGGHSNNGFLKQWATTPVGVEALLAQHNDLFLPMDEISQVSSEHLEYIGYMFGNSVGKIRGNLKIKAVAGKQWSVMLISTGEHSIADKLAEKGIKEKAGIGVRISSIPADAGAIMPDGSKGGTVEKLNGFASAEKLVDTIKDAALKNYGHAFRLYMEKLVGDESVREKVEEYQKEFLAQVRPLIAGNSQASRVAKKFSTIAAAGELAINYELLPWDKGSAIGAADRCFRDWLKEWGTLGGNRELYDTAKEVFAYFRATSRDHFDGMNLLTDKASKSVLAKKDRHGFIKYFEDHGDDGRGEVPCFVMQPDDFYKFVCSKSKSRALLDLLKERNLLVTDNCPSSLRKKVRVGSEQKPANMIVIKCSIKDESLIEE
jgi:uncharacterized protein (DUF927 family)